MKAIKYILLIFLVAIIDWGCGKEELMESDIQIIEPDSDFTEIIDYSKIAVPIDVNLIINEIITANDSIVFIPNDLDLYDDIKIGDILIPNMNSISSETFNYLFVLEVLEVQSVANQTQLKVRPTDIDKAFDRLSFKLGSNKKSDKSFSMTIFNVKDPKIKLKDIIKDKCRFVSGSPLDLQLKLSTDVLLLVENTNQEGIKNTTLGLKDMTFEYGYTLDLIGGGFECSLKPEEGFEFGGIIGWQGEITPILKFNINGEGTLRAKHYVIWDFLWQKSEFEDEFYRLPINTRSSTSGGEKELSYAGKIEFCIGAEILGGLGATTGNNILNTQAKLLFGADILGCLTGEFRGEENSCSADARIVPKVKAKMELGSAKIEWDFEIAPYNREFYKCEKPSNSCNLSLKQLDIRCVDPKNNLNIVFNLSDDIATGAVGDNGFTVVVNGHLITKNDNVNGKVFRYNELSIINEYFLNGQLLPIDYSSIVNIDFIDRTTSTCILGIELTESSDNFIIGNCNTDDFECSIDGKVKHEGFNYPYKNFGNQTWMTKDLIVSGGTSTSNQNEIDNAGNLYNWKQALNYPLNVNFNFENETAKELLAAEFNKGICPDGWHIPTKKDWEDFEDFLKRRFPSDEVGTMFLDSRADFCAPENRGAAISFDRSSSLSFEDATIYWTSSPSTDFGKFYSVLINRGSEDLSYREDFHISQYSCRCIKD